MREYFERILNLRKNTDFEKTKTTISEGVTLQGYNLWILVCSTILTCIGLDTNSTAIIIGGMLISPLMSPILGVGLSVAIHDKLLLGRSLKNLTIAALISLGASILYFFLSPLSESTTELQARTFPTLLDVLVALFGGIAGIISISRHFQTNAVPGVAIATALMPPLCTAGFGIATMHWNFFLGAFYLFFINAVFISLATYLIVRYLHFPEKKFLNKRLEKQYRLWFIVISIIALTPSTYFLYSVYKDELVKKDIEELVITPIKNQGNEVLKWEVVNRDTSVLIKVYHSGLELSDSLKQSIDSTLQAHHMKLYQLVSMRVNLTKQEVSELSAEMTKQMFQEFHIDEIKQQNALLLENAKDTFSYPQILQEVKIAFPFIDSAYNGWLLLGNTKNSVDTFPVFFYNTNRFASTSQTSQLYSYLRTRLAADTVVLIKK